MDLNWEYLYGRLNDGHYRIVKRVMDYRAPGDYDEYDICAEFDIVSSPTSTESVTDWMDITDLMSVDMSENGTIYVEVTDTKGRNYSKNARIVCFDFTKPTLNVR